MISVVTKFLYS